MKPMRSDTTPVIAQADTSSRPWYLCAISDQFHLHKHIIYKRRVYISLRQYTRITHIVHDLAKQMQSSKRLYTSSEATHRHDPKLWTNVLCEPKGIMKLPNW